MEGGGMLNRIASKTSIRGPRVHRSFQVEDKTQCFATKGSIVIDFIAAYPATSNSKLLCSLVNLQPSRLGGGPFRGWFFTDNSAGPFKVTTELRGWFNHKLEQFVIAHPDISSQNLILDQHGKAKVPHHLTQPKRSQALPHTNHPHPKVDHFIRPSNKLAVAINPSRCRYVNHPVHAILEKNTFAIVAVPLQSNKTFRTKQKLAKAQRQNRPIPQWIRLRTGNTISSPFVGRVIRKRERGTGNTQDHPPADRMNPRMEEHTQKLHNRTEHMADYNLNNRYNAKRRHWRKSTLKV
ncbi:Ribosomal protein L39e [Penicillium robsamsonii]|uniref:Ribosomal protein L39e n=1 Tax=Penicillium robsamsonii TaxID=1792511 RepID=UPI0025486C84|nr:Ribosomal protein L39e [Penicillium robsamsonii]KAJ5810831.1 Ribosomal protein L39e [Penicillium robsamsonii]